MTQQLDWFDFLYTVMVMFISPLTCACVCAPYKQDEDPLVQNSTGYL